MKQNKMKTKAVRVKQGSDIGYRVTGSVREPCG